MTLLFRLLILVSTFLLSTQETSALDLATNQLYQAALNARDNAIATNAVKNTLQPYYDELCRKKISPHQAKEILLRQLSNEFKAQYPNDYLELPALDEAFIFSHFDVSAVGSVSNLSCTVRFKFAQTENLALLRNKETNHDAGKISFDPVVTIQIR